MFDSHVPSALVEIYEATHRPVAGITLVVASAGTLLVLIAFSIPIATLSSTSAVLEAGPAAEAWILSGMSVGAAATLLASGAIGDDYGRRRVFLIGMLTLAVSSVLAAFAPTGLVLVFARILQGAGGAAVMSCGLGLIGHTCRAARERTHATAIWAAALGAGAALGPILAAGLDAFGGWRLPYLLTAVIAAALAIAGRKLPESRANRSRRIDMVGTLLLGLGLAAALAGLTEGRSGWARPPAISLLAAAFILLAGFVSMERRIEDPLLDLALFRRSDFVVATIVALTAGAGVLSLLALVPTLLDRAMGASTLVAATVLLAWSATSVVTAFAVRWLPARITPRAQLIAGLLGCGAGQLALAGLSPQSSIGRLLPGLLMTGAANGVLNAALGHQAVATVPADRPAMGGGANNTARYFGTALGLTVVTELVTHGGADSSSAALLWGWNISVLVTTGFSLLGAVAAYLTYDRHAHGARR